MLYGVPSGVRESYILDWGIDAYREGIAPAERAQIDRADRLGPGERMVSGVPRVERESDQLACGSETFSEGIAPAERAQFDGGGRVPSVPSRRPRHAREKSLSFRVPESIGTDTGRAGDISGPD